MKNMIIFLGKFNESFFLLQEKVINIKDDPDVKKKIDIIKNSGPNIHKFGINGSNLIAWLPIGEIQPKVYPKGLLSKIKIILFIFNLNEPETLQFLNEIWVPIIDQVPRNETKQQIRLLIGIQASAYPDLNLIEITRNIESTMEQLHCDQYFEYGTIIDSKFNYDNFKFPISTNLLEYLHNKFKEEAQKDESKQISDKNEQNSEIKYEKTAIFQERNSISYKLYERRKIADIVDSHGAKGEVIIPKSVLFGSVEYDVIKIDDKAFSGSSIESLSFQSDSSLKIIGNSAFENTKIRRIFIPRILTKLEDFWCQGANELNEIEIDTNNLLFSNRDGFIVYNNDITNQILFAPREFKGDFLVPEGTTKIGEFSFSNRQGLHSIKSSTKTLQSLGSFSFSGCQNLAHVVIKQETSLTLCSFCFSDCKNLLTIEISCSDLEIQNGCFNNCTSLSSFKVMKSETIKIHQNSFRNCTNLQEISFNNSSHVKIENECVNGSNSLKLISFNEIKKVTLFSQALKNCQKLESLSIINTSQLDFGKEFFNYLTNLKKINLCVDSFILSDSVINKLSSLTHFNIQTKSDIIISPNTFKSSALKHVTLKSPKVKLCSSCFSGLQQFECIEIECKYFEIGYKCFYTCLSFFKFKLKCENDILITYNVFCSCFSLKFLSIETKSKLIIPHEFMNGSDKLKNVVFGGQEINIGDCSFKDCTSLSDFMITKSGSIQFGNNEFSNCIKLEQISIESGTNSRIIFGDNCFCGATNLREFSLNGGNVKINNNCFKFCSSLSSLFLLKMNSITIAKSQLSNLKSLNNIIIESNTNVEFEMGCFFGSTALQSVTILGKYITFSNSCFQNCSSLSELVISHASSLVIGTGVFLNCSKLLNVSFEGTSNLFFLTECFNGSSLQEIRLQGENINFSDKCFGNCKSLNKIITGKIANLTLGKYVFTKCNRLENVNLCVTKTLKFEDESFIESNCKTVSLQGENIVIGNDCFKNCSSILSFEVSSCILEIGNNAFNGCENIKQVKIETSSKIQFGDMCFFGAKNLSSIELLGSKAIFGNSIFCNCSSIQDFSLQNFDQITLGNNAFEGCYNLEKINIKAQTEFQAGNKCFYNLNKLKSVFIACKNVLIGSFCFADCSLMTLFSIQMADKVKFCNNAFTDCKSLVNVKINASNKFIASSFCFNKSSNLKTVEINSNTIYIGTYCFGKCASLQHVDCLSANEIHYYENSFDRSNANLYLNYQPTTKLFVLSDENNESV